MCRHGWQSRHDLDSSGRWVESYSLEGYRITNVNERKNDSDDDGHKDSIVGDTCSRTNPLEDFPATAIVKGQTLATCTCMREPRDRRTRRT